MISAETTFILGPGSSAYYYYPTAKELKRYICNNASSLSDRRESSLFVDKFGASPIESIDKFLSLNPNFQDIGKRLIAYALGDYEKGSASGNRKGDDDWYSLLFQKMLGDIKNRSQLDRFYENKVKIVSFNYDRSLEDFFYKAFKNTFHDLEDNKTLQLLEHIKIYHVYGQFLPSPWERGASQYGGLDQSTSWDEVIKRLRVIGEERVSDESLKEIQGWISQAKRIYFLGFGYREENLEVLNLPRPLDNGQAVYGTALDCYFEEIDKFKVALRRIKRFGGANIENANCLKLLRKYL